MNHPRLFYVATWQNEWMNERAYILGKYWIKTDNWLKLFELNCLQFRKKNNPF